VEAREIDSALVLAATLTRYDLGDVAGALELSRRSNQAELTEKLSRFQALEAAGGVAMAAQRWAEASESFEAALALDGQLSRGSSFKGAELKARLAELWNQAGVRHLAAGDMESARRAFQQALKFSPNDLHVQGQLSKLRGISAARTTTAKVKAAIDEAWDEEDEESPEPEEGEDEHLPPKAGRLESIDDAFDE
jgi:tetratricopeptide (TPR) repeat protein